MDEQTQISALKEQLRRDVSYLSACRPRSWTEPIGDVLRRLREAGIRAAYFGGTLRSLLVTRQQHGRKVGRPRDIDLVIVGSEQEDVLMLLSSYVERKTRFGGLKLRRPPWQFDMWPIEQTWAFEADNASERSLSALPTTTFLNLEAIAVDAWTPEGKGREIYSGDDQFFRGLLSRTVDINREHNPCPELNAIRGTLLASSIQFRLSRRLADYIVRVGQELTAKDCEYLQVDHYGTVRTPGPELVSQFRYLERSLEMEGDQPIPLPQHQQLSLFGRGGSIPSSKFKASVSRLPLFDAVYSTPAVGTH